MFFIGIGVLAFALGVDRQLGADVSAPEGLPLETLGAPLLEEQIERVPLAVGARRLNGVLLTLDDSASVSEIGTFGVVGRKRIYLTLGVPFLLGLSPAQFEAVVAHELAHVSGRHGRWSRGSGAVSSAGTGSRQRWSFRCTGAVCW